MNDKNITINFASEKKFRTIEIQKQKSSYTLPLMQMVLNDNFVLTYIDTLLGEKKTVSSTTLCAQNAISNKN